MSEVMRHERREQVAGAPHLPTNMRAGNIPEGLLHGDPVGEEHERGEPNAEGSKRAEAAYMANAP